MRHSTAGHVGLHCLVLGFGVATVSVALAGCGDDFKTCEAKNSCRRYTGGATGSGGAAVGGRAEQSGGTIAGAATNGGDGPGSGGLGGGGLGGGGLGGGGLSGGGTPSVAGTANSGGS